MKHVERQNGHAADQRWATGSPLLDPVTKRFVLMDRTVDLLIALATAGEFWPELYDRVEAVLGSLPLGTGEFTLAARRLRNALVYSERCDFGPAAFELRMLRGQLTTLV